MASDPDDDRTLNPPPTSTPSSSSDEATLRRRIAPTLVGPDPARVQLDGAGRYRVRELLGQGGVGEVWLVEDGQIDREVAVKRLRRAEPGEGEVRRFIREAKLQGQIEHPAVVPVHDLLEGADGHPYFVMRRIRGLTLKEIIGRLADGRPEEVAGYSRRRLLTAFSSVCLAVHYAHTRGVIHRDLKPDNVMLGDFGEVYLLDWGLAKRIATPEGAEVVDAADSSGELQPNLTEVGKVMGTPAYMAPEQIQNRRADIGPRTDIYALGIILFELLTRQRRHGTKSVTEIFETTLRTPCEAPSLRAADVPVELDAVCQQATARDPADRFASARELADAIDRFLDGDRDLEKRRALADQHAARAQAALSRSRAGESSASSARLEAVSEVMQALALDPQQGHAREALVRLLTEMPDQLPPEAEQAMAAASQAARRASVRFGVGIYLSWLACIGYAVFLGVRSWLAVGVTSATALAAIALCLWMLRTGRVDRGPVLLLAAITLVDVAMWGCWLGPFVLVPVAAACCTLIFCSQADPFERRAVIAMGVVASLLPYAVEWLGLVPPSYAFAGDHLILMARSVDMHPAKTTAALVYTSMAFTFFPAYAISRVRDSLVKAQRKLFLHAWHFDQLARALEKRD
jgi:serine/threonine protein kinase